MRLLVINTDYPEFLRNLYLEHPGLAEKSYQEQMRERSRSCFGIADFYSANLRRLGHEAWDIHANNEPLQKKWASERGLKLPSDNYWGLRFRKKMIPWVSRLHEPRWFFEVLSAQIKHAKPDVLVNTAMDSVPARFMKEIKSCARFLVGQIAAPLPQGEDFGCYDLVLSSLPNLVSYFRGLGLPSEIFPFAFERKVLDLCPETQRDIQVSFVGSLSSQHHSRIRLLESLCEKLDIEIYGNGIDTLAASSPIRKRYKKTVWGIGMYRILSRSRMTINHHIDIAGPFANNMRLFEATGTGTLLVTDQKENLQQFFDTKKEIAAYANPQECAEVILHYLDHEKERADVAAAGQTRTLKDHTYAGRMEELMEIVKRRLSKKAAVSTDYRILTAGEALPFSAREAWREDSVVRRQDDAYRALIGEMRSGRIRKDLESLAEAIRLTGEIAPRLLEVGCGSGYYSEILPKLLTRPIHYFGLDDSPEMIRLAKKRYPGTTFILGDATKLPFADGEFDIVVNGVCLMHMDDYRSAIAESRRVAKRWCVFHTVPVLQKMKTCRLKKKAYGSDVLEIIFNEDELTGLFAQNRLAVRHVLRSIPYDLNDILGEPTVTKTYVCQALP